jgi:hypothetical protein
MTYHKKCPPGVICIENITMGFLVIVVLIVCYLVYTSINKQPPQNNTTNEKIIIREERHHDNPSMFGFFTRPNYSYNNFPGDVLLNPYAPPLNDERYMVPSGRIPVNVSTNVGVVDTNYRQSGILTPLNGPNKILPLMGRPLYVNRDKWQYYTLSDQNNSVKLPVVRNGKSCTNEYGCDKLYNGDSVYVEGYNQAFKVTIYDDDTIKYIPYL